MQKFLKSCDVVFKEGGPILHFKHIILKPNNTPSPATAPTFSTPATAPTLSTLPIPPTPSCPKHATHPPIPDDDLHYSILSYRHHANLPNTKAPKLKMYDEAMASPDAAEWLAACKEKMHT